MSFLRKGILKHSSTCSKKDWCSYQTFFKITNSSFLYCLFSVAQPPPGGQPPPPGGQPPPSGGQSPPPVGIPGIPELFLSVKKSVQPGQFKKSSKNANKEP